MTMIFDTDFDFDYDMMWLWLWFWLWLWSWLWFCSWLWYDIISIMLYDWYTCVFSLFLSFSIPGSSQLESLILFDLFGYGSKLGTPIIGWLILNYTNICGPLGLPFWPTSILIPQQTSRFSSGIRQGSGHRGWDLPAALPPCVLPEMCRPQCLVHQWRGDLYNRPPIGVKKCQIMLVKQ